MSKTTRAKPDQVLDDETLQLLGEAPATLDVSTEQMRALRGRVMKQIDEENVGSPQSFQTVRDHEGAWIEIAPKLMKKVLLENPETGSEAYLLKAEPGAEAPAHPHQFDEHCIVLEGEVTIGGVHLKAGDYHFAAAGSAHGIARTEVGVLLYLQSGVAGGS